MDGEAAAVERASGGGARNSAPAVADVAAGGVFDVSCES